jgi:hypothetical protein
MEMPDIGAKVTVEAATMVITDAAETVPQLVLTA